MSTLSACSGDTTTKTISTPVNNTPTEDTPTDNTPDDDTPVNDTPFDISQLGLNPELPPSGNFDLLGWYLNTPKPNSSDLSTRIDEVDLADGFEDPEYFYTAADGGMVFKVTNAGARTSSNTSYPRTELREMLRRGNTSIRTRNSDGTPNLNNWVFSTAPQSALDAAGGIDGTLQATLAVNAVTTTGLDYRVGRVIVGQIHALDDEPVRLYYRKLPNNTQGSIYAAHEIRGGEDKYYAILGNRSDNAANPSDGIALDEVWSYEIKAVGHDLTVTIRSGGADGTVLGVANIDMTHSGYDIENEFMYFKAGAYHQNNADPRTDGSGNTIEQGGDPDDFAQVTFYVLDVFHD